jgi:hypothetical protein
MPIRPEEFDLMQSYLNGAPREDLQARLDSMYGPVTPDMRQAAFGGADARTAQNMSTEPAMSVAPAPSPFVPTPENIEAAQRAVPPAPPPVATDAGGMSVQAPAMSEGPAMSTISPEQLASMGQQAEARLASSQASTAAPSGAALPPPQSPENAEMQRYLIGGYRGGGGRVVPGGEQLASRTVTRELRAPLSPETSEELEAANIEAQGMAVGQGESAAGMLEKQAAAQAEQAQRAREDLAQYKRVNAAKQAEYDMQRAELDDMRAQVQREPITFFSGDTTGHAITKTIGLSMLGLLAGPMAVMQAVNNSIAQKEKERGQAMTLLDDQLDRFKAGIPSPEAQQLYTRSLGLDAAAAEADRMANLAKAEDARQRGFALAEQLRREALQARAAAQSVSLGKEEIKTANVPTKVVGGAPGGMAGLLKRAKELGLAPEQALYLANRGQLPSGGGEPQTEFELKKLTEEMKRRVTLPNGEVVHARSDTEQKSAQSAMDSGGALLENYDRLGNLTEQVGIGGKIASESLGEIEATISDIALTLKDQKQLGVLSESDMILINPLTGREAGDLIVTPKLIGQLRRSRELVHRKIQQERAKLLTSPYGSTAVGRTATQSKEGLIPSE